MDLYLFRREQQTGPYTEAQARALVAGGEITRDCPAWQEGMAEWLPLEEVIRFEATPAPPAVPVGLPPVPAGRSPAITASTRPRTGNSPKAPEPMRLGTWINHYGFGVFLLVVFVCRWLSGCHHQ